MHISTWSHIEKMHSNPQLNNIVSNIIFEILSTGFVDVMFFNEDTKNRLTEKQILASFILWSLDWGKNKMGYLYWSHTEIDLRTQS